MSKTPDLDDLEERLDNIETIINRLQRSKKLIENSVDDLAVERNILGNELSKYTYEVHISYEIAYESNEKTEWEIVPIISNKPPLFDKEYIRSEEEARTYVKNSIFKINALIGTTIKTDPANRGLPREIRVTDVNITLIEIRQYDQLIYQRERKSKVFKSDDISY